MSSLKFNDNGVKSMSSLSKQYHLGNENFPNCEVKNNSPMRYDWTDEIHCLNAY